MSKGRKKDAYWHRISRQMIEQGFKPAQIGKVLKEIFPETEVNGRHIGAYKRRLIQEGVEVAERPTITMNEASDIAYKQMNDEETKKICEEVISKLCGNSIKEMGKVMGELKKKHADEIDFSQAGAMLKQLLNK